MTPMDCSKADGLLDAWLDDELESSQRTDLNAHLEGCVSCGQLRDDLLQLRSQAQELDQAGLAAANWNGLRQRLEAQVGPLNQHSAAPGVAAGQHLPGSVYASLSAIVVAASAMAGVGLAWWTDQPSRPREHLATDQPTDPVVEDSSDNARAQAPITPAQPKHPPPEAGHSDAVAKPEAKDTPAVTELVRAPEPAAEPPVTAQAATTPGTTPTATRPHRAAPEADPSTDLLERLEALARLTRTTNTSPESQGDPTAPPQEPLASRSVPVITSADLPGLAALLQDPLPATIRRHITQVLVEMEGEAVQACLEEVLRTADPAESRATAAWTLAARGHKDSRPALQHIAEHDPSAFVRNAARAALEKLDGDGRTGRTNR